MSGDDNYTIETTDSGASETVSVEAGQIRKGGYIMVKGKPCKVRDVSVSKTGKHGHAKCKFMPLISLLEIPVKSYVPLHIQLTSLL